MSSSPFSDNGEQGDLSPLPSNNNNVVFRSPRPSTSAVVFHTTESFNNYERKLRKGGIELEPLSSNSRHGEDDEKTDPSINSEIVTAFKTAQQTVSLRLGDGLGPLRPVSDDLITYATDKDMSTDIHLASFEELAARFESNVKTGLSSADVPRRITKNGKNVLTPPKTEHILIKILKLSVGGFNWLLIISAILLILSWEPLGEPNPIPTNWYIGVVLFIVVVIGVFFSAYQTRKSSNILRSFRNMIPPHARVLRDGEWKDELAESLQLGDIVKVSMGSKVPADVRLFEVTNLKLDNSMLTGESDPVSASVKCTSRNHLLTKNLAFFGSMAVEGSAIGMVVAIGDNTVMGKISHLTGQQANKKTSLHEELDRFVLLVCLAALTTGVACTIGWAAWLRVAWPDYLTWQQLVVTLLSLVVAYVPEGLPLAVTMTLSIVAKRMAEHNVLVKDLSTIETFNIITLVCSDKTGTLTQNKMSVSSLVWGLTGMNDNACTSQHQQPPSNIREDKVYWELFRCATLCNNAQLQTSTENGVESTSITGDASDSALYAFCDRYENVTVQRGSNVRVALLPFNSKNKYMISIHKLNKEDMNGENEIYMFVKGAPEIIMNMCDKMLNVDGSIRTMTHEDRTAWANHQERLGSQGERVLGFSMIRLDPYIYRDDYQYNFDKALSEEESPNYPTSGLVFLGLISLYDAPRVEVPAALHKCRTAQIRVAMVTGDHPTTGAAIAKQIGLLSYPDIDKFEVRQDEADRLNLVLYSNGVEMGAHVPSIITSSSSDAPTNSKHSNAIHAERALLFNPTQSSSKKSIKSVNDIMSGNDSVINVDSAPDHLYSDVYTNRLQRGLVIVGPQINLFDDVMWDWVFRHDELVFARTTPQQKLEIVMEAQKRGEKVAVTGDGVNDAPALRKANLGIAMQAGSEVAREAGHIVLMDNNFNSIVIGLELGRVVFDNLKKVCIYLLPAGTFSEMLTVFTYLFVGINSMLSNFQMLMISVCSDVCVSVAMVNEKAESDIMTRRPRRPGERLVDLKLLLTAYFFQGVISFFAATINYFWYCSEMGLPFYGVYNGYQWGDGYYGFTSDQLIEINATGQSIFFVSLVITQWGNALAVRTRTQSIFTHNPFWGRHSNPHLGVGILFAFGFLLLFTLVPFFQNTFLTRQVPIKYGLVSIAWAFLIVVLDEIRKLIVRRFPKSILARVAW